MIPFDVFAEVYPREDGEHTQRDNFLNDFQLKAGEFAVPDAIGGNLKAVFQKRDHPAYDNYGQEGGFPVFQVTVPGDGHKNIGTDKKKNGSHGA
jgi:hypothetical protein